MLFRQLVLDGIGRGVEAEAVLEAAAAPADDAHSQDRLQGHLLLGHDALDFLRGLFGNCH